MDLKEFADIAYAFMTGIPARGSAGFCMMGPDELRRQRMTYVRYWMKLLGKHIDEIKAASKR
jgi:hypothetical protein